MNAKSQPRKSGNPAKQAALKSAAEKSRAEERAAKLAEYQKNLARRRRNTALLWTLGTVGVIAVVTAIIASFVLAPKPEAQPSGITPTAVADAFAPGPPTIEGVEVFSYGSKHVEGTVDYPETPPVGGEHSNEWLYCGVYTEPQNRENATHSMEHGAVWITYDPALVTDADIEHLRSVTPDTYAVLSPYPDMGNAVTVSGWNVQLKVDSADDTRLGEFIEQYWQSPHVPEPGASCAGVKGPGLV